MEKLGAKLGPDSPVGRSRSKWSVEDMYGRYDVRQIYSRIVSEEPPKRVSQEIKRLKENISGLPITDTEIMSWIVAQDTEHMDVLRKLLDKQFKEVCLAFLRVSQNSDANMFLRKMLATFKGPWAKCVPDVHGIIYKIIKHLQGKREMILGVPKWTDNDILCLKSEGRQEISNDIFISQIGHGTVQIGYSPNRECLELSVVGSTCFTRVEWHTSVRHNKLVQLLLFEDWSVMDGAGDCLPTLQPQEVKDAVCYVSRTSGGTGGGIPPVRRVRHGLDTFKRRQCIVTTGSSDTPYYIARSGRIVASQRGIGLWTGTPCYIITRGFRLLAATRRRRAPLWIYDTGSSISLTGKRRLLRGVHNAHVIYSAVVNGTTMASSYCGRISGKVNLSGVRYVRGAKVNLISGGKLADLGCETIQNAKGCKIMKDGQLIGVGRLLPNKTYSVDILDDKLLHGDCPYCCQH